MGKLQESLSKNKLILPDEILMRFLSLQHWVKKFFKNIKIKRLRTIILKK